MLSDLYSDQLLAAAGSIPPVRRLETPDATSTKVSRVCGSEVVVDLMMKDGKVADFGLEARACALGQASSSLLAAALIGASVANLYQLRDEMYAMLKENGAPPADTRWRKLAALQAVREYPQRHASTLLVFDAVCDCLDQIAAHASRSDQPRSSTRAS